MTDIKKIIYRITVLFYLTIFLLLVVLQILFIITGGRNSVANLIFWMFFAGLFFFISKYKLIAKRNLKSALGFYVIACLFVIFHLVAIGEMIMKISLIFWIVGLAQAFLENKKILEK